MLSNVVDSVPGECTEVNMGKTDGKDKAAHDNFYIEEERGFCLKRDKAVGWQGQDQDEGGFHIDGCL